MLKFLCLGGEKIIKQLVCNLVGKYGTNSPFELCKKLNINVLFVDLPESVDGFFLNSRSKSSILIKKNLSMAEKEKVCAHELAHALLHSRINAINYEEKNPEFIALLENEANSFSKFLLEQ